MPSLSAVVRRIRSSSSAVDFDTEAGRAFLQERVAFFNKVNFLISGAFFLAGAVLNPMYGMSGQGGVDLRPALLHAATLVVSLLAWQACRRVPKVPTGMLLWIDTAAIALPMTGFSLQALFVPVKPENVIVCERGGVPDVAKVVDFGLVKDMEDAKAALTRADVVQGTPLYLAPEAITAPGAIGPRSDLYALGGVGYYLVCGRPVFEGATLVEVCSHHLHTPP